ncbi:HK97 gp10 family phage protein [Nocardioides sp.]|uniref:HK97 gp10 family phage protein n=1 Tax=Nocardioides sp. TaxID=35761 RepID=UPI002B27A4BB|nr:HK97 gp10 family phage protein [Nocardioides sp.]
MVDRAGFKVEGLTQVVRALQEMGVEVDDLKDAFSKIADEAAKAASSFAPRDTGRLAKDIRGNRAKSKAVVTAGRSSVPYAGAINYGWPKRGIQASGFMQRADQTMQTRALQLLEDEINQTIREKGLT